MPEQRIRAILAQRLGSGEIRVRKVPAWESRREGISRLPANTPDPFSARKGDSLPRRDVVQTWARFGARRAEILPSKDDVPGMTHNVPAWESFCSHIPLILPSQDNARAKATQRPCSGGLLPPDAPASPERGRCADRRCASTQLRRITAAETEAAAFPRLDNVRAQAAQHPGLRERYFAKQGKRSLRARFLFEWIDQLQRRTQKDNAIKF